MCSCFFISDLRKSYWTNYNFFLHSLNLFLLKKYGNDVVLRFLTINILFATKSSQTLYEFLSNSPNKSHCSSLNLNRPNGNQQVQLLILFIFDSDNNSYIFFLNWLQFFKQKLDFYNFMIDFFFFGKRKSIAIFLSTLHNRHKRRHYVFVK